MRAAVYTFKSTKGNCAFFAESLDPGLRNDSCGETLLLHVWESSWCCPETKTHDVHLSKATLYFLLLVIFFFILLGFSVLLYCPCHQSYSIIDINYKQQIDSCSSSNQKHLNLLQLLGLGQHLSDWKQAWIKSQTSQLQVKVKVTWESFPRASRLSPSQYSKIRVWIQFPRF